MSDNKPTPAGKTRTLWLRLAWPAVFLAAAWIASRLISAKAAVRPYIEAVLVLFVAVLAIRLLDTALRLWYDRRHRPLPIPDLLRDLVLAVLYLVVLFFVLNNILQVNIAPILATSAILTMIVGLALQGVLGNLLSGISLHITKTFSRGDWVGIAGHEGIVLDTNWREMRLLDRQYNIVVVPNTTAAAETITNFSHPDKRTGMVFNLKMGYEAPPDEVIAILLQAARDCPEVLKEPAPQAFLMGYEVFGVSYKLKFWSTDFTRKNIIIGDVARLAWYKLRRRGLGIPVSMSDGLRAIAGPILKTPAKEALGPDETECLRSLFEHLRTGETAGPLLVSDEELKLLASLVRKSNFGLGEVLFRQGDLGTTCFIVVRGRIRGEIAYHENEKTYTSEFTVGRGEIFGEMSLFTGMPRTATGVVIEGAELLEIDAASFAVLLKHNPALAEAIAEVVSARNARNVETLKKIKELSAHDIAKVTDKSSVLAHLKRLVHSLTH